jgi:glycosyltransferase involved in cell wall biosynthesis
MAKAEPYAETAEVEQPLVSIVTVALNRAASIGRTIESVLGQSYRPIEHVVIDGGSRDGTVEVIGRYADWLAYWVSEPDRGISDAFNKGLARTRGALIGLVNADDWLAPEQIATGVAALRRSGADFVFGDLVYHAAGGGSRFRIRGDPDYARAIGRGMPDVNHPTLLARRAVYERVGGFDPDLRFAMDYDWLLRAHRAGFRGCYEPALVGHMTLAGVSDRRFRLAFAEVREIAIRHGQPRLSAWALYGGRLAKSGTRRLLERLLPAGLHERMRRRINRQFTPEL